MTSSVLLDLTMAIKMKEPLPDVLANGATSTRSTPAPIGPDTSVVPARPFMGRVVPEDPAFFGDLASPADMGSNAAASMPLSPPSNVVSGRQNKDKIRTPFFYFLCECADDARAVDGEAANHMELGDFNQVAGELWDQMSDREKQPYVDRAREEKAARREARLAAAAAQAAATAPPPPPPSTAPTSLPSPPASPNMFDNGAEVRASQLSVY